MDILYYLHVLGAAVWVGGLITLGGLVPAVRRVSEDRGVLRAMARRFAVISWTALGMQMLTGILIALDRFPWSPALNTKVALILVSAALAAWHTVMARDQSPAVRGALQGAILLLALVIVALATMV